MDSRSYIWLNGDFLRSDAPAITLSNRSFAYGDGYFETMHAYGTEAVHTKLHFNRLCRAAESLEMELPSFLTQAFIETQTTRLLNKNRIFGSARVRVTIFRNEGGFYTPTTNTIGISMQAWALEKNFYPINSKGLVVDFYAENRKPINALSPFKSCNASIYTLAGLYKQRVGVDDCILINDQNRVAEAISSNIFGVKGNNIYTPPLTEGCVDGIMRSIIIEIAPENGLSVNQTQPIEPKMLFDFDELFLTNAVSGIQWIVGLRQKRYFGVVSKKLSQVLNKNTFNV
jgi:branched-subunit amino acid aminotransferase/4-amino-4-deoxychorismate lyase